MIRIRDGLPIRPSYTFVPLVTCESFTVRVRFDPQRLPWTVWRLDRVPTSVLADPAQPGPALALDGACEVAQEFAAPQLGYAYGLRWWLGKSLKIFLDTNILGEYSSMKSHGRDRISAGGRGAVAHRRAARRATPVGRGTGRADRPAPTADHEAPPDPRPRRPRHGLPARAASRLRTRSRRRCTAFERPACANWSEATEAHAGERDVIARYRAAIDAETAAADRERWADGRTFSFERVLAAPRDVVWRHWIDPAPARVVVGAAVDDGHRMRPRTAARRARGARLPRRRRRRTARKGGSTPPPEPERLVFDLAVTRRGVLHRPLRPRRSPPVPGGTRLRLGLTITETTVGAVPVHRRHRDRLGPGARQPRRRTHSKERTDHHDRRTRHREHRPHPRRALQRPRRARRHGRDRPVRRHRGRAATT